MTDDVKLEECVLTWVNSFINIDTFASSFIDLSDGVALLNILQQVDRNIWKAPESKSAKLVDKNFKFTNLLAIFKGLQVFYEEMFDIKILEDTIDLETWSELFTSVNGKLPILQTLLKMTTRIPIITFKTKPFRTPI